MDYKEINGLGLAASLAKVGVGGSNPLARSNVSECKSRGEPRLFVFEKPRYK